jgi:c-di-AMP phosphodiesterase-like protein
MDKDRQKRSSILTSFSTRVVIIAILIICAAVISIILPLTLYMDILIIFILCVLAIIMCVKEIKDKKYRLNELSKNVDLIFKESLDLIDVPMAIVGMQGNIIWKNNYAEHLLPNEYIEKSALKLEALKKKNPNSSLLEELGNGEVYNIICNSIKFENFDCMLVTFIDKTYESTLKKSLEDSRVAIGMLFIDNYEETMQGLDEIQKAEVSSILTKEIRSWARENNGVLAKLDKDKYAIFIEKKYVEKIENDSFDILERVRNLTKITKLPITLSIGVSYNEETLEERYNAGQSALDIALGRGGDQAVVKKDKKYDFFGGSNIGLEKTSKVKARTMAQAIRELIEKSEKIYVMGHRNSDLDCIGAAIGISKIAKFLNKSVNVIVDNKCNASTEGLIEKIKYDKEYEDVFKTYSEVKNDDFTNCLLIVVDTHKKSYLVEPDLLDKFENVAVIDHHRRGPEFIDNAVLTYHEIYASSATELVVELLMYMDGIEISSNEAECMYAGLVVDTKNFMFKTGVRTFEVAAYLKKFGIDVAEIKLLFQNDFDTYVAKVDIVKNAEFIHNKIAISVSNATHEDMPIIVAQAADELLSISGIQASFVLCMVDGIVMISGRSMGDINVQTILEKIGGGGHLTFAGAQMAGTTLEEAKAKLLESIEEYLSK